MENQWLLGTTILENPHVNRGISMDIHYGIPQSTDNQEDSNQPCRVTGFQSTFLERGQSNL